MSNITSENLPNSSKAEILQEKELELAICRGHLITYRLILSQLEEFLEGEKPFAHFHLAKTADITFNCGCCTWSGHLKLFLTAEVKEYFKSACPAGPKVTLGYEIHIPNSPFTREEQYIEIVNIDQPPLNSYKFPELPNWMQEYLLKRLEHAKALLAIYETGIKNLEEEIKHAQEK